MGWLAIPIAVALAGCELLFPLDGETQTPPPPSRCFDDNFDAPVLDAWWEVVDPGSPHVVTNASPELLIDFTPLVDGLNGVRSKELQQIEDARVTIFVSEAGAVDGFVDTAMELRLDAGTRFQISVGASTIVFRGIWKSTVDEITATYVDGVFTYWAIRHEPGAIVFDTMDDSAQAWIERHRVEIDDVPPRMTIQLYGDTFEGGRADPGAIRFDDFRYDLQVCP